MLHLLNLLLLALIASVLIALCQLVVLVWLTHLIKLLLLESWLLDVCESMVLLIVVCCLVWYKDIGVEGHLTLVEVLIYHILTHLVTLELALILVKAAFDRRGVQQNLWWICLA
jgi:hypothetical protein